MQFSFKLKYNPDNPKVVFEQLCKDEFGRKENVIRPFGIRCEEVDFLGFNLEDIATHKIPDSPLRAADSPTFLYDLAANKKATTDPLVFFKISFLKLKSGNAFMSRFILMVQRMAKKLLQLLCLMVNYSVQATR